MACSNPIKIYSDKYKTTFTAPCNHCLKCRIDRRNTWADRINFECKEKRNAFITLTFDDEHIDKDSLTIEEPQKFIKRLRRKIDYGEGEIYGIGKKTKFKYYLVGEYGETFGRKHYHAILMGLDFLQGQKLIQSAWGKGQTTCLPVNTATIRYVLKYIDKQLWGTKKNEIYGELKPPFALMSKGIGKDYIAENLDKIIENNGYKIKGKIRPIPKYWKDLIQMEVLAETSDLKRKIELMKRSGYSNMNEYIKAVGRLTEMHIAKEMRNRLQAVDTTHLGAYEPTESNIKLTMEALNE